MSSLSLSQIAARFGVSSTSVKRWIERGYLHNTNPDARYQKEMRVALSEVVEIEMLGGRIHGLQKAKYPEVVHHLKRYKRLVTRWDNGEEGTTN